MTKRLGALGVMFGDIGTSPLYPFRQSLKAAKNSNPEVTVLGVQSLLFWALILVVAVKYVLFVMRADNHGKGGTMAVLSLAVPASAAFNWSEHRDAGQGDGTGFYF